MIFTNYESFANFAKNRCKIGLCTGQVDDRNLKLMERCKHLFQFNPELVVMVIFTRDTGHHTSGWWKNPDYERCYHASMSFFSPITRERLEFDKKRGQKIAEALFGEHVTKAWIEGPYSEEGKANDVWHYRVFCNEAWEPILPRKEVYSKDETPVDWKSFSEVHGYTPEEKEAPFLLGAA